ncbi:hypothetical protein P43SY_003296 [Pythium insidiosum]|uniref:Uncharacterized protein n=1 Tax=Pythium insidiosum TaxID=114742 RepID=A0AAD5Q461_PYTIN|nr:hypothetical protein P43SY_003296 [Pythium insidiosum]
MTLPASPLAPDDGAALIHPGPLAPEQAASSIDKRGVAPSTVDVALPPAAPHEIPSLASAAAAAVASMPPKESEVRADVAPAPVERCQLEDFTPFSRSHLWKLMMSFYDRQGVESWAQGIVPHFITSNTFIAKRYCQVLRAFLRDGMRPGSACPLDPTEPLYIVELGTGSGKFSFYFLKALVDAEDALDFPLARVKYVMTDFTEQNFNFWRSHPALAPFVARGLVDFAIFDATKDASLRLHHAQRELRADAPSGNPICVIANYLFDTLYHDLFQVDADGVLREGLVSVGSKRSEEPDPLDPEIIKRLANLYRYDPIDAASYYGPDAHHLNNILRWYHDYFGRRDVGGLAAAAGGAGAAAGGAGAGGAGEGVGLSGASVLVPIGALSAMARLSALAAGQRLVVLSGDKGNNHPEHFRGLSDPHIAVHGSFSVMVNYHAIGVYAASRGGFALHSPQEEASLKVSLFVLLPEEQEQEADGQKDKNAIDALLGDALDDVCAARSRALPHLARAFEDEIVAFGPNDFFVMQKTLKEDTKAPSLKAVLALLKLSGWDPDTFYKFRDVLLDHSPACAPKLKRDVRQGVPSVWRNYYSLDKEKDIAFEIGRLYYGLHDYDAALAYYTLSMQEMGRHHVTSHNMGLCHYSKRQLALAASCFEEASQLNPSYQKAATWLQRVRKELAAAVGAATAAPVATGASALVATPETERAPTEHELLVQQIELVMADHEEETARPPTLARATTDSAGPSSLSAPRSPPRDRLLS